MDKKIILNGVVLQGLGEGAFFMSMPDYRKRIKKKLGFDAYPGTLNLKISKKQADLLKDGLPIKISGFRSKNKAFGALECYKAKVKSTDCAVVVPQFNKHKKDIIELIAPVHLKSGLKLKNGSKVKVEILK